MKEPIRQIREFLAHMAGGKSVEAARAVGKQPESTRFTNAKLLQMVREVADVVQPLLKPYQAAFYWFLFRHSVLEGDPLIRVTREGLRKGVVKQQRGLGVSATQVRKYLKDLEGMGAIRWEGASGRLGSVYRVHTPAEIEACRNVRVERVVARRGLRVAASELDFYNVRANRRKVYERDGYLCRYCLRQLTDMTATLDHVTAVAEGGGNELANLVTACLECNTRKQDRALGDFLAERSLELLPE